MLTKNDRKWRESVKLLVQQGADPTISDNKGRRPVHTLVSDKASRFSPEMLSSLLRGGALDARDADGATPLHAAARQNNERYVEALLRAGADPNVLDKEGFSPLYRAAVNTGQGRRQNLIHLLDNGADPNLPMGNGKRLLELEETKAVAGFLRTRGAHLLPVPTAGDVTFYELIETYRFPEDRPGDKNGTPFGRAFFAGKDDICVVLTFPPGMDRNGNEAPVTREQRYTVFYDFLDWLQAQAPDKLAIESLRKCQYRLWVISSHIKGLGQYQPLTESPQQLVDALAKHITYPSRPVINKNNTNDSTWHGEDFHAFLKGEINSKQLFERAIKD